MTDVIYALEDHDGYLIYVGATRRPAERKREQVGAYRRVGRTITFHVLEEDPPDELQAAERRWIADGRSWGWPLENRTAGGDGCQTVGYHHTDEMRSAQSARQRGVPHTRDRRAAISAAVTGVAHTTPAQLEADAAKRGVPNPHPGTGKGTPKSAAHRASMCIAQQKRRARESGS